MKKVKYFLVAHLDASTKILRHITNTSHLEVVLLGY